MTTTTTNPIICPLKTCAGRNRNPWLGWQWSEGRNKHGVRNAGIEWHLIAVCRECGMRLGVVDPAHPLYAAAPPRPSANQVALWSGPAMSEEDEG